VLLNIATLLAGLGLFFYGLHHLGEHLKQLAGPRVRRALTRATATRPTALGVGAGLMIITQSAPGSVFILVSLISAGLISVAAALPAIIGVNLGGSMLIFVATIDVEALVLLLLGLAGIGLRLKVLKNQQLLLNAVFAAGLLLLGIILIKTGAEPVATSDIADRAIGATHGSMLMGLIAGIVLTALTQSSIAIIVLAVAMASAGVLPLPQAMMIVYGSNVGSSLLTYLLSSHLVGRMRQVSMFQVAYNLVGGGILVPLLFVEVAFDIPLVAALMQAIAGEPGMQIAVTNAAVNIVPAVVLYPLTGLTAAAFHRIWPPTKQEDEGRLAYLHDQALSDPDSAVTLAALEQRRLVGQLRELLELARHSGSDTATPEAVAERSGVAQQITDGVGEYLDELIRRELSEETLERLSQVLQNQRTLAAMTSTVTELSNVVTGLERTGGLAGLASNIVEAIDSAAISMDDLMAGAADAFDRQLWDEITSGRSDTMRRIREDFLTRENDVSLAERRSLLTLTNLCERFFWLAGQLRLDEPAQQARVS
jgi:phosphate:Na+ symporter